MNEENSPVKKLKGLYGVTFLIGLGFFTMGLMDPLYDTYIPVFLKKFISSRGLIGSIMTLDNLFALLLIPVVAALSDKTRTRIGRRMPYIIVTLPLTAITFTLIPFSVFKGLATLIILIFFLNLFKQSARGPVVALMPDIIPGEYRSEANGVINAMGGIAAITGTLVLARLMDVSISIPGLGYIKDILPFPLAGLLVILATLLLFLFIREKRQVDEEKTEEKTTIRESLRLILFREKGKSAFLILVSLFLWFLGYQGILPFIGLYSIEFLGTSKGTAAFAAGMVAVSYTIFAIPSGIVAHKIGRRLMIRVCLIALSIITFLLFLHHPAMEILNISGSLVVYSFWALTFLFGIFWGSVITNSFPMLWQMACYNNMGIYTGLYYFFSQMAAIVAPPITGVIIDVLGFRLIFLFASVCMLAAFILMGFVTSGEVKKKEKLYD
ncbi:MAG: MFS transporter [Spirochaetales bacterium]|nr:MFS transporter [Spirochaetales bacterium]